MNNSENKPKALEEVIHGWSWKDGKKAFEFVDQQKILMSEMLANQAYPFELMVDNLTLRRDVSRNPIFDTMFLFKDDALSKIERASLIAPSAFWAIMCNASSSAEIPWFLAIFAK